ncbi:hypothetical protein [Dysosmobacter sp.]|uniref:hypothetical protein n=1 Tax=Dysosmobacter sp. TaxID=2591382 RepID=UPI002A8FE19D|nr:hypothetical protein [Dysosmobacter sp.]MDY3985424.1 hypothetical protein [Dysosmobacter sp.]
MRKGVYVPMIALCLLLTACGGPGDGEADAASLRDAYHDMTGCTMEAAVTCVREDQVWTAELRCGYVPDGDTTVEVLSPEPIAGVRAVLHGDSWDLEYEDLCLDVGTLSSQELSPMACLPRLMDALRDGWLLEENKEEWEGTPCLRLTVDQSGIRDGKILSTLWLRLEDGTPLRGEVAVEDEIILTAEFTAFSFYDMMEGQEESGSAAP